MTQPPKATEKKALHPSLIERVSLLPNSSANGKESPNDKGRLYAWRHGVLGRHLPQALAPLGQDLEYFRGLKQEFRPTLQPRGKPGVLLFNRFGSSYLPLALLEVSVRCGACFPSGGEGGEK